MDEEDTTNSTYNLTIADTSNTSFINTIAVIINVWSLFIFIIEMLSINILNKCVLITDQIKLISKHLVIADLTFHLIHLLWWALVSRFDSSSAGLSAKLRLGIVYTFMLIYCLMMVLASTDRFISIRNPLQYELIFTQSVIKRTIHLIWAITVGLIFLPFIFSLLFYCQLNNCDDTMIPLSLNQQFRMSLAVLFVLCDVCVVGLYAGILSVAAHQTKQMRRLYPNSTRKTRLPAQRIMIIVAAYVVLYSPAILYTFIFDILRIEAHLVLHGMFYLLGFRICTSIHSCISLYYFMYSMPECRMHFMNTYLFWSERLTKKSVNMKVELFNIPTVQRSDVSQLRPDAD